MVRYFLRNTASSGHVTSVVTDSTHHLFIQLSRIVFLTDVFKKRCGQSGL